MGKRLTIKRGSKPAMIIERTAVKSSKLVYVICQPRPHKYAKGSSKIVYIGMTSKGVGRVASSIAKKASDFLSRWGCKRLESYILTCPRKSGTRTWETMERDLLVVFKIMHGSVPLGNKSGKNFSPAHLSTSFRYTRVERVIASFG